MSELKKEMVHGKNSLKLKDLWKKTFVHRRRDILENPRLTVQICEEYPLYRKASFVSCFCGYGLQGHIQTLQVSLEFELIQHKNGLKSLFVKNWITWQAAILCYAKDTRNPSMVLRHALRNEDTDEGINYCFVHYLLFLCYLELTALRCISSFLKKEKKVKDNIDIPFLYARTVVST